MGHYCPKCKEAAPVLFRFCPECNFDMIACKDGCEHSFYNLHTTKEADGQ